MCNGNLSINQDLVGAFLLQDFFCVQRSHTAFKRMQIAYLTAVEKKNEKKSTQQWSEWQWRHLLQVNKPLQL